MILVALLVGGLFSSFLARSKRAWLAQSPEQVAPTTSPAQDQSPTTTFQDRSLAEAVQETLQADNDLGSLELMARQDGPVIYLKGTVPRPELKAQAETLAKEVAGVGAVDSSGIAVAPPPLAETVWQALQANPDIGPSDLEVEQIGHNVRLTGSVPTVELKELAVEIARGVEGVALVDSSGITVVPPPLAEMVQGILAADSRLASLDVAAEQVGNDVRLSGTVTSPDLKELAEELAGEVTGVGLVDSRDLAVEPPPLAETVRQALHADVRTTDFVIEADQVGYSIRLQGAVPSLEARVTVELLTRGVAGVELVDTGGLRVEPPFVEYVVQAGDSLAAIARKFYGDETKWPLIYEANQDEFAHSSLLRPGTRLIIPRDTG